MKRLLRIGGLLILVSLALAIMLRVLLVPSEPSDETEAPDEPVSTAPEANAGAAPLLFRNQTPQVHHWVQFRLRGTRSTKSAVGARVTVTTREETQIRFIDGGNSFAGQSSARLHFGLGATKQLDSVEVRWPGGPTETFPLTQVDRTHTLVEGKGK